MKKAVIVLPTYNEKYTIVKLLRAIQFQESSLDNIELHILVVDDSSPDGTGEIVKDYAKVHPNVHLLNGTTKKGVGTAYARGFSYAIRWLHADIVLEMVADFSHDPELIPQFISEINKGNDIVIGSYYVSGSSVPKEWSFIRKINNVIRNTIARYVAGMRKVKDCTSGYRAIDVSLLKKLNLKKLGTKGHAFQINLLHKGMKDGMRIAEIPQKFVDIAYRNSTLSIIETAEYFSNSLLLRFPFLRFLNVSLLLLLLTAIFTVSYVVLTEANFFTVEGIVTALVGVLSILMIAQGVVNIFWILYAWENVDRSNSEKLSNSFLTPKHSFTALVPAKNEEKVIGDTLQALANMEYPTSLVETLVICRIDDDKTIAAAKKKIDELALENARIITFDDHPVNKPHALNLGLLHARNEIVVIFDAEDQPHKDIYNVANTVMTQKNSDVLQCGVQLMNFRSSWFSTLNVLEYYFWFKSTMHYFAKKGFIPLGGNSVFFKKKWLNFVEGWDENCLTEDGDIGVRLSAAGASINVIYDEKYVTKEETPPDTASFIKQRTRWNQGFIQILLKGDWLTLPKLSQRLLALYVLLLPEMQALFFFMIPLSVLITLTVKLPMSITLLAFIPLLLLALQIIIYFIGLHEFTKSYRLQFPFWMPLKIVLLFLPYQLVLGISSLRAILRSFVGFDGWEKTKHTNAHRQMHKQAVFYQSEHV